MILYIIFSVLVIAGLVLLILGLKVVSWQKEEPFTVTGVVGITAGVFGLIVLGILTAVHNNPFYKNYQRIEIEERIESINNTRKSLEYRIDSNTVTVLEISSYNETVREFKTEVKQRQVQLKNPWINWICCPVYNEYSPDMVSYLYI